MAPRGSTVFTTDLRVGLNEDAGFSVLEGTRSGQRPLGIPIHTGVSAPGRVFLIREFVGGSRPCEPKHDQTTITPRERQRFRR